MRKELKEAMNIIKNECTNHDLCFAVDSKCNTVNCCDFYDKENCNCMLNKDPDLWKSENEN